MIKRNMYHLELPYEELDHLITDFGHDVGIIKAHQYITVHSLDIDADHKIFKAECEVHEHALH